MSLFIVRRLLLAALVCLTVLVVSFILTRLSGDLAASIAGPNASAADIAIITKNYGLDRPLVVQFLDWAGHAAEGRSGGGARGLGDGPRHHDGSTAGASDAGLLVRPGHDRPAWTGPAMVANFRRRPMAGLHHAGDRA